MDKYKHGEHLHAFQKTYTHLIHINSWKKNNTSLAHSAKIQGTPQFHFLKHKKNCNLNFKKSSHEGCTGKGASHGGKIFVGSYFLLFCGFLLF